MSDEKRVITNLILRVEELEKKVDSLDLEKKLKIDYMLKMNQLVKNDKAHQALYDKIFKEIAKLREQMDGIIEYNSNIDVNIHGDLWEQLNELKEKLDGKKEK